MDPDEIEEEADPVYFPDRLSWPTNTAIYIGLLTWMLDITMMVVAISAWAGGKKPKKDETDPLKLARITWTAVARKVQAAEIAIAVIGLIWNNVHFQRRREMIGSLFGQFTTHNARQVRRSFERRCLPADLIMVTTWMLLVVYQAQYVPLLGRTKLAECVTFGTKLDQCKMVNGSWVCAIIYSIFHTIILVMDLELYRRLFYPDDVVWPVPPVDTAPVIVDMNQNPGIPEKQETRESEHRMETTETRDTRRDSDSSSIVGGPSKIE